VFLALVAALGGVLAGFLLLHDSRAPSLDRPTPPGLLSDRRPLTPFQLVDQNSQPFDLDRLRGRWTFLFFGYTHCPDICPATLSLMGTVSKLAREAGVPPQEVQIVFVTVDPARDTPTRLAEYVGYFGRDFLALSGPLQDLNRLTRQLGILHYRAEPDARGDYLVDHTAGVLLIDPKARWAGLFGPPHEARDITDRFLRIRAHPGG